MIKAVIFDIDGTLIDSVDLHARAWQDTFVRYGCNASFQEIRDQIGKGGEQFLAAFLPESQVREQGDQIQKERGEHFKRTYMSQIRPFPRVQELFKRLSASNIKVALGSSAKSEELQIYKGLIGIDPYLHAETSADDAEKSKPEPDIFLEAVNRLGSVDKDDIIVIGDTPWDTEAATKAGLRTIGFLCGGVPREKLLASGCIAVYQDAGDLVDHYDSSPLAS